MNRAQLSRVRWAVRLVLVLGVAASVAANILHARPNPTSQTIAAWPPLALLLTVELVAKVPVRKRGPSLARLGATTGIASIAAWVSYWHMAGVASRYGEAGGSQFLLPLTVDGLIVVASVCLVELGARTVDGGPVRVLTTTPQRAAGPSLPSAPVPAPGPSRMQAGSDQAGPTVTPGPSTPADDYSPGRATGVARYGVPAARTESAGPSGRAGERSARTDGLVEQPGRRAAPSLPESAAGAGPDARSEPDRTGQDLPSPQVSDPDRTGPRRTATPEDLPKIARTGRTIRTRTDLRAALADLGLTANNALAGDLLRRYKDGAPVRVNGHPVLGEG